jgi:hypothetical protein
MSVADLNGADFGTQDRQEGRVTLTGFNPVLKNPNSLLMCFHINRRTKEAMIGFFRIKARLGGALLVGGGYLVGGCRLGLGLGGAGPSVAVLATESLYHLVQGLGLCAP